MTDNKLITSKNERIVSFFKSLDRMLDGIEGLVRNCEPSLSGGMPVRGPMEFVLHGPEKPLRDLGPGIVVDAGGVDLRRVNPKPHAHLWVDFLFCYVKFSRQCTDIALKINDYPQYYPLRLLCPSRLCEERNSEVIQNRGTYFWIASRLTVLAMT